MKKILLSSTLLVFFFTGFANGINFIENKSWKDVLAMAKEKNKLIFLDAYASWCGPCKYLQRDVFTDAEVGKFFNDVFINVKMDMEEGEGPGLSEQFRITAYPTLFFINGDGVVVHKYVGALEVKDFISLAMDAIDPEKQQYKIKQTIADGTMPPAKFHSWIHTAEEEEDPDLDSLITAWLANTSSPLFDKEMLEIILDHADILDKKQIDELYKNRVGFAKLVNITPAKYDAALVKKISHYAYANSFDADTLSISKYKKTVAAYYPAMAALESQKAKVYYYGETGQGTKCLRELSTLITTPSLNLVPAELTSYVLRNMELIINEKRGAEFVRKVAAYKIPATHTSEVYFKDLTIAMLYSEMNDKAKMKEPLKRILANKNAPDNVKELAQKMLKE